MKDSEITKVWLIRHGEPAAEGRGRCYGRLDVGISQAGREQMKTVTESLSGEALHAIYASPRRRTAESAEILSAGRRCKVTMDERVREIDFGDFEGLTYDEIATQYPDLYWQWMEHPTDTQFPNGEHFQQMQKRVLEAMRSIVGRHRGEAVAVVTHGGVSRIVLANALGMPAENMFRIGQRYAAINLIQFFGDYPCVELINGKQWFRSARVTEQDSNDGLITRE